MTVPELTQLFAAPKTFHIGYDLFIAVIGAVVLFMLFKYIISIYRLTYKSSIALFSTVAYLFSFSYVLFFSGRYVYYAPTISQQPLVSIAVQKAITTLIATSFLITTTFALILLAAAVWKIQEKQMLYFTLIVIAAAIVILPNPIMIAILIQLASLASITPLLVMRAISEKKASTFWLALSSAMLFFSLAQFFAPWSFHFKLTTYLFGTVIGFSMLFLSIRAVHQRAIRQ